MPEEFLRDTSYWMEAEEMESFLALAEQLFQLVSESDFIQKMAHSVPELRAWGLLDSVLRMMPRPQDILSQPERFLSYFISPQPPVENLQRNEKLLEMDVPIHSDQYPYLTHYLRCAFETLPVFSGQAPAECEWKGMHFKILWSRDQESIFQQVDVGRHISPELLQSVVDSLEQSHRDLNELRAQKEGVAPPHWDELKISLRHQLAKLADYMVRAQQLITLLMGQNRMSPAVKEAMKRVDWERVLIQYPQTIEFCQKLLTQPPETTAGWTLEDFVKTSAKPQKTRSRRGANALQTEMFHVDNRSH